MRRFLYGIAHGSFIAVIWNLVMGIRNEEVIFVSVALAWFMFGVIILAILQDKEV